MNLRFPFLTAHWRDLIVVNYEVDPSTLATYLPVGTELDLWEGKALVSLVAFQFLDTRVLGLPIPFHRNFEEVNLRFYVKRMDRGELKRGVVFIKELVPRPVIAAVANFVYGENYMCVPMSHAIESSGNTRTVSYGWESGTTTNRVSAELPGLPLPLEPGSEAEFILEHYWGYVRQSESKTSEYEVTHPAWRYWDRAHIDMEVDIDSTYGPVWGEALSGECCSAFVAEGSEVAVFPGTTLTAQTPS
jgi:hypothetical protein